MAILWLVLVALSTAQEELRDGVVADFAIDAAKGGDLRFRFYVNATTVGQDLFLTTTTFSDWANPEVYVSAGMDPTRETHDFATSVMNIEELEIPASELQGSTDYHILVHCPTYCRFSIVVSLSAEIVLPHSNPIRFSLDKGQEQVFTYTVEKSVDFLTILLSPISPRPNFDMFVTEGGLEGESKPVTSAWLAGKSCYIPHPRKTVYWILVVARENGSFLIAGSEDRTEETLIASNPTYGVAMERVWKYYKFFVDDGNATVFITETVYSGEFCLYMSAREPPTESQYGLKNSIYDNSTISLDKHQRETFGLITGWYYIGIYSDSPSAYVLTVSINEDGLIPLRFGDTHSGFVDQGERFPFYFDIPPQTTIRISVKVYRTIGDLSAFMKLCTDRNESCVISQEEIQHSERYPEIKTAEEGIRMMEIAFLHRETQCQTTVCRYVIVVVGKSKTRTNFEISAWIDDETEHVLRSGVPASFSLPASQSTFFRHRILDPRTIRVSFQLTIFSGRCFLCISPWEEKPHPPICVKSSENRTAAYEEVLSFYKGVDLDALNVTFYASVTADNAPCAYSLVSSQEKENRSEAIRMELGLIQRDSLDEQDANDAFRLYSFALRYSTETEVGVDITLTPLSGTFELFVSNNITDTGRNPTDFRSQWSINAGESGTYRENSLHIATTDNSYRRDSTYLVMVKVKNWSAAHTASYSLVVSSGDGCMTLQTGVPQNDIVSMQHYRYYVLPIANKDQSVTVTVTAVTGDPDLYVSAGNRKPQIENYWWMSVGYGSEVLSIIWDPRNTTCSSLTCHLFLSVYGYSDSAYSIMVSIEDGTPVYIVSGIPQAGTAKMGEYRFYYSFLNIKQWFQASLQSFVGEASIQLNILSVKIDGVRAWTMPNVASAEFKSENFLHFSRISLHAANLTTICGQLRCRSDLSVYCRTDDCRFSLTVSQTDDLQLVEGNPQLAYCYKTKPAYFRFYNGKDTTNIIARVAGITSGDADLYVSKGTQPTSAAAMWQSVSWGNEFLEIPSTDPIVGPALMKGEYFLTILCDRDMTISVSVTTNAKALVRLVDGQPHSGYLHGNSVDYFYYPSVLPTDIVISLTVTSGNAIVFAIPHDNKEEDIFEKLPNDTFHYWSATPSFPLVIPKVDFNFCTGCNIVLSVKSRDFSCIYTLLARNQGHISSLVNGEPLEGRLASEQGRKYAFQHVGEMALDISLSVFAGKPTMTVAITPLVSESVYIWSTSLLSGAPHLHISPSDPSFHKGLYFIYVYSEEESSYSLTAHSANSVVSVVAGWPQTYSCQFNTITPLYFDFISDAFAGVCKVISLTNSFSPSVYAKFTPSSAAISFPSPFDYQQLFTNYDIFYQLKLPLWTGQSGKYVFAVYGNATKAETAEEMGDFQFFCLSANRTKVITLGEIEMGVLDSETQMQEFVLHVSRSGFLTVVATPCAGKLELLIRADNSSSESEIKAKRVEDGRVSAHFPCHSGRYFIYISALEAEEFTHTVSFQITTSLSQANREESAMYYPGNSGIIEWTVDSEREEVLLQWNPPETEAGEPVPNRELVKYRIYATVENANLTSACGMDVYEKMSKAWLVLPSTEQFSLTSAWVTLPISKKVWVNVLAILDPESREIYHVPYTSLELFIETDRATRWKYTKLLYVLTGIVLLLLLVILVLAWKYMKAKKYQMQLVEMLDVETISKEFNQSLKSNRKKEREGFKPISQDASVKED